MLEGKINVYSLFWFFLLYNHFIVNTDLWIHQPWFCRSIGSKGTGLSYLCTIKREKNDWKNGCLYLSSGLCFPCFFFPLLLNVHLGHNNTLVHRYSVQYGFCDQFLFFLLVWLDLISNIAALNMYASSFWLQ